DGWQVLEAIKPEIDAGLIVIIITAFGEISGAVRAIKLGAYDFIEKPFDNERLLLCIRRGLDAQNISTELNLLKSSLDKAPESEKIFGTSNAIRKVIQQADLIAPTDYSVFIFGETGSGKEVVANYIHRHSARRNRPFIAVDCGAIPESLLESELFGFEKGSFTGAFQKRHGKFLQANGGTLYLDEIGNLPLEHQKRFLRAIDQKTITPIGSTDSISIDVRYIIATNSDLEVMAKDGKFRNDLYYRLVEYSISIPPLRERQEDIPYLAHCFLKEATEQLHRNVSDISEDAIEKLTNYQWYGNVRQLRTVIRNAALIAHNVIMPVDIVFPLKKTREDELPATIHSFSPKDLQIKKSLEEYFLKIEKETIIEVLQRTKGNITKAAELFGISRQCMSERIKKFRLKIND
ncbi:MAG: sigma-54 dependent transcriptional regulator, partial [Candidatus Marinimicrobia bacterium]|nr:sigma-54 dependent transcriptional regulator [Candidatus Neomarinimicrobiota bacterium]